MGSGQVSAAPPFFQCQLQAPWPFDKLRGGAVATYFAKLSLEKVRAKVRISPPLHWRTRTPPIRTMVEVPIRFDVKSEVEFLYQRIRGKVAQLARLGMKQKAIADALRVHPKTVRKSLK